MLKKKMLVVSLGVMMLCLMSGCGATEEENTTEQVTTEAVATTEQVTTEEMEVTEQNTTEEKAEDAYAGVYLDYENNEPNLTIKANGDGTYKVEIGVFRLAVFEDDDAILTDVGIEYESVEGTKGVITLEGNEAVVTVTESTWDLAPVGTVYRYHRPSTQ